MNSIEQVKAKIKQIEKSLMEVKNELRFIDIKNQPRRKKANTDEILPSEQELKSEYEKLYRESIAKNYDAIRKFVEEKSKFYLKSFCKTNNLPIDTSKNSKNKIFEEILQWLAQQKAIRKKAA